MDGFSSSQFNTEGPEAKSRTHSFVSRPKNLRDRAVIEALTDLVGEVYRMHLTQGQKFDQAQESAGAMLGISPRTVRGFLSGEVNSIPADRADAIRAGHAQAIRSMWAWHYERARQLYARFRGLNLADPLAPKSQNTGNGMGF